MGAIIHGVKVAILSAYQKEKTNNQNKQASDSLAAKLRLNGFDFSRVKGYFSGNEEESFVVIVEDEPKQDKEKILELARYFKQNCVLYKVYY